MSLAPWAAATLLVAAGSAPLPFRMSGGDWATPTADMEIAPERREELEAAIQRVLPRDERGCFLYAIIDLDGDGMNELLVQVRAFGACGLAGCPLVLLRWKGHRLVVFSRTELVRNVGITPWTGKGLRPLVIAEPRGRYREMRATAGRYPEYADGYGTRALNPLPPDLAQVPWMSGAKCDGYDLP